MRYNQSKTRQSALNLGAVEVTFLRLVDWVYEAIDTYNLTFTEGVTNDKLTISEQMRLSVWIRNQESELIKVGAYLRLSDAKARNRDILKKIIIENE